MRRVPAEAVAARRAQARREAPQAIALAGGVAASAVLLDLIRRSFALDAANMLQFVMLAGFAGAWLLVRSRSIRDAAVPWVVAVLAVVVVGTLLAAAVAVPSPNAISFALLAMVSYAPFVLDRTAMLTAAAPMAFGYILVIAAVAPDEAGEWFSIVAATFLVGFAIQYVRLRGIDELARANEQVHRLATRDPLTGVLNRTGIDELVPGLVSGAERRGETVFAVFVDVDGLKAANDQLGHDVGDQVIEAVAEAVRQNVRASDVVARWGGDEFLVLGAGPAVDAQVWEDRLNDALVFQWQEHPGAVHVSAGVAIVSAADFHLDALLRDADADMYARRRRARRIPDQTGDPSTLP